MKRITVLLKPTNACNLRCVYCYHADGGYDNKVMDTSLFNQILEKIVDVFPAVHFIWHGGEPLLLGDKFYSDISKIEDSYASSIKITNAIQTNGTLLDENFINLLDSLDFQIGFSFDGESNNKTRGFTHETLSAMELVTCPRIMYIDLELEKMIK